MKKNLFKLLAIFAMLLMIGVYSSCDKSDDSDDGITLDPSSGSDSSGNSDSSGDSGSSGNSDTPAWKYVYYRSVNALKLTLISNKASNTKIETIDIYEKSNKYYWGHVYGGETYYETVSRNSSSSLGGVDVSKYGYWSRRSYPYNGSVEYWYYFNL